MVMKFSGIEIKNFKSIGNNGISINPLKKCNILIGRNNVGKSNVLKAIKFITDHFRSNNKTKLAELDLYKREKDTPFIFTLFFTIEKNDSHNSQLLSALENNSVWFTFKWGLNAKPEIIDHSFAQMTDFHKSNLVLHRFTGRQWSREVTPREIKSTFLSEETKNQIWNAFQNYIPTVNIIPEFRKIRGGEKLSFDGEYLIETLALYQQPEIGKDEDQKRFNEIEKHFCSLLNLPNARVEISKSNPTLIINDGIRLPLSSFGTSVHELLILLTSITSMDNSICCIEEPEIHFHPLLQKEFLQFLLYQPSNTFIINTHSPSFINAIKESENIQLIHLKSINNTTEQISVQTKSETWDLLKDIGISPSDLLQSNCVIWVEGPSDIYYINRWISLLDSTLKENKDFSFFCYRNLGKLIIDNEGGDNYKTNIFNVNRNSIVIMDSDKKNEFDELKKEKNRVLENCTKNNVYCWITKGREIENYLTNTTIKKSLQQLRQIEADINIGLYDNISELIDRAIKEKEIKPLKYDENKNEISKKISEFIELDDIKDELKEKLTELIVQIKSFN